jgi:hypothetical protein
VWIEPDNYNRVQFVVDMAFPADAEPASSCVPPMGPRLKAQIGPAFAHAA